MPSDVTNYQCPACTGPLHYSAATGKLECDYCGSSYTVAEVEAFYAEQEKKAKAAFEQEAAKPQDDAEETWHPEGMKAYNCPSCGAELLCDETTAATSCPYCGNPTIVPGQFSAMREPDYILPFKLDRAAAVAALKKHYHGKFLLPRAFRDEQHLEEVKGVYVPFWLYDMNADADASFTATRSHVRREGDWEVTTTEHFLVQRAGDVDFTRIPADGSKKMPDDYMDSIEPFRYEDLQPFSTAYLPGFLADRYDVDGKQNLPRIENRCRTTAMDLMRQDVHGYEAVVQVSGNVTLKEKAVSYALLPVWILNTRWRDKTYLFTMNGQTGRLVGDLPVDRKRYWLLVAGLTVLGAAISVVSGFGFWLANFFR